MTSLSRVFSGFRISRQGKGAETDAEPDSVDLPEEVRREKATFERAGRLHRVHWAVIALSLVITLSAWQYSGELVERRAADRFARYSTQIVEMITERMGRYEDALWGGTSAIYAKGGDISHSDWKVYADSLRIGAKYPGINGIGVVHYVAPGKLDAYMQAQRKERPDYRIHPPHRESENLPISYIEPVAANRRAVGLDMAHERNRYTAALKARDTGRAQITGPIVLVQDSERTPGFLFYAPFYTGGLPENGPARQARFAGLVYAPFIVKRLMAGTLQKDKREISVKISDGEAVLYNEHVAADTDYDANPMFRQTVSVPMYGRNWSFEIITAKSFRDNYTSSQPTLILVGGILIDVLLIVLFVSFSRTNRRAIGFAGRMSRSADEKAVELEKMVGNLAASNEELERFAYVASHDLQEPLRMVRSFTVLLRDRYGDRLDDDARNYMKISIDSAERMQELVSDLLQYARMGEDAQQVTNIGLDEAFDYAVENLSDAIRDSGATVTSDKLPVIRGNASRMARVMQNLIGNGLKYQAKGATPTVHVSAEKCDGGWIVSVQDNGIGIAPEYHEQVLQPFRRLHNMTEYSGTGMGLAICRKIVLSFGGEIWVDSEEGKGSTFCFSVPEAVADAAENANLETSDA
tara:strand:- start:2660 stop:4570 length:1911 start_codon:yes stop_codon:yes gene_type:complete